MATKQAGISLAAFHLASLSPPDHYIFGQKLPLLSLAHLSLNRALKFNSGNWQSLSRPRLISYYETRRFGTTRSYIVLRGSHPNAHIPLLQTIFIITFPQSPFRMFFTRRSCVLRDLAKIITKLLLFQTLSSDLHSLSETRLCLRR
jgi:hypothetical protein